MPLAVTHILVPILIVALVRDFYLKKKDRKSFPLHYVLIAGIGGVLPDFDIALFLILSNSFLLEEIHKTITHTIFLPSIFFALFLLFKPIKSEAKICNIGRHNLKLSLIFLFLSFGTLTHILLDSLLSPILIFYPFSSFSLGYNILTFLPENARGIAPATLDGVLLVVWIVYLELKHKISDFI